MACRGLAFATAFVTLFAQILVHRMASLKLLNNLAFLVISLTMLGFALSGVVLSRWLAEFLERRNEVLVTSAALFALTLVVASWLFYGASGPTGAASDAAFQMPYWMLVSLLFAVPFAFFGLNLGLLLSSPDLPARRIYGADLAGSALGACAVIPAIGRLGVETSSLVAAAGLTVTCLLAPARRWRTRVVVVAAGFVLAIAAARPDDVFRLRYPGYLAIEVALLQKFGLLLGHPNYALSVVLAALLLASGLGALQSSRIVTVLGGLRSVTYLLAVLMLVEYAFLFPRMPSWVALPFLARVLIVVALVGPIGILLGTFVPVAIEGLKQSAPALVPWPGG